MNLYAQQGYGTGNKIIDGLSRGWIDGAILSPKDNQFARLRDQLDSMTTDFPMADRLVDPQFYATLIARIDGTRLGRLAVDYPYFEPRRRGQLESETQIRLDLEAVLRFQADLPVTHVIAPNIIIPRSLNSVEAVIAKNFIRNTQTVWATLNDERPIYATLAVSDEALRDRQELEEFLIDITVLDEGPDGFYLLVYHDSSAAMEDLIDSRTMAAWLLLNHSLKLNGYQLINGYSDILTPFLAAAGADAGATGWWSNLKVFSLERFEPAVPGGQQPVPRYLSCGLLNSIRFDELQRIRDVVPRVLNDLDSDDYYPTNNGSRPDDRTVEMLQTWEAIRHLNESIREGETVLNMRQCQAWVNQARNLYVEVNTDAGLQLFKRSNDAHLDPIRYGIEMFADLAEIDLSADE